MMENQHRLIKGYRELSVEEIELMNLIKSEGVRLHQLLTTVHAFIEKQNIDPEQSKRVAATEAARWLAMAKTDFQTGLMKATRAVAQPEFF